VGIGERSVSVEKRRSCASAVARSARSMSLSVEISRSVHVRPLGAGVAVTRASTVAPLAVRTGRVICAPRSRRRSSFSSPPRSEGSNCSIGSWQRSSSA
jgi:hypothetical protein